MGFIKKVLCEYYNITEDQLYDTKRRAFNEARAMGLCLARQLRGEPLKLIGKQFAVDNYSTVSSAIERFKARLKADRAKERRFNQIVKAIMSQEQTLCS